jgi:voltage-gated potassium channel
MINKLMDHIIICGYGRVGRSAVDALLSHTQDIVIVEKDGHLVEELREEGILAVYGDATKDDVLKEAGIERAKGLMVCSGSDADNLFIVLSARSLNSDLFIVARMVDPDSERKMLRAGANRVISPYQLGGRFMANILTHPRVTEFLGLVTLDSGLELWLEEYVIEQDSPLDDSTVIEADLRKKIGVTLVGVLRQSSGDILTPDGNTRLVAGDILIVLGTREQLGELEFMTRSGVRE